MLKISLRISIALAVTALLVGACKKGESVPVGGECSTRDDCQTRNDCLKLPTGKSVCTQSCMPNGNDCPAGTTCKMIDLTVSQGSKSVGAAGIPRCVP